MNNRLEELKDDIKSKKGQITTLDDADQDLLMMDDDDETVQYQIGEIFITMSQDDVREALEKDKEKLEGEVEKLEEKSGEIRSQMSDLKTHLYAKFGNAINLEADED